MGFSKTFCITIAIIVTVACLWGAAAQGEAIAADGFIAEYNGFKYYAASDASAWVTGMWIKMVPGEQAHDLMAGQRLSAGLSPEKLKDLDYIMFRASFFPEKPADERIVLSEQIYIDNSGEQIADWSGPDWSTAEPPAEFVAREGREFLIQGFTISRQVHTPAPAPPTGFCGVPWGSLPTAVSGAKYIENVEYGSLALYEAEVDATSLLGAVPTTQKSHLIFNKQQGLICGSLFFDGEAYNAVLARLTGLLGQPEKTWAQKYYWLVGSSTVVELIGSQGNKQGIVQISERQFWLRQQQH